MELLRNRIKTPEFRTKSNFERSLELAEKLEDIKKSTVSTENTKEYILKLKRIIDYTSKSCEGELTSQEAMQALLDEYEQEFKNGTRIFLTDKLDIFKLRAQNKIASDYKSNKNAIKKLIAEAKRREKTNCREIPKTNVNLEEAMISELRSVLRFYPSIDEQKLIKKIETLKNTPEEGKTKSKEEILKDKMIQIIRECVEFLNELGVIDEYIEAANDRLENLDLAELKFTKRNYLPDEAFDLEGNPIKLAEDWGILDYFHKDKLEQLSLEELILMATFWKSKYFQERLNLYKAMITIDSLDLWEDMANKDESFINEISEEAIEDATKKDLALSHIYTYLSHPDAKLTPKIENRYQDFIRESKIKKARPIMEEMEFLKSHINNLEKVIYDQTSLQCLLISGLESKYEKVKAWGEIPNENLEQYGLITIAIEHQTFRGPLIMTISRSELESFLEKNNFKILPYKNAEKIDEEYSEIMMRICVPKTNHSKKVVKQKHKENKESQLFASLAGKDGR